MLGAIIGDIVGSVYEWNNINTNHDPKRPLARTFEATITAK
jgi:ADP-ribosylglycohydrolase